MAKKLQPQMQDAKSFLYHKGYVLLERMMDAASYNNYLADILFDDMAKFIADDTPSVRTVHVVKTEFDQLLKETLDQLQGSDPDRGRQARIHFWEGFLKIQHGAHPDDLKDIKDHIEVMKTSLIGFELPKEHKKYVYSPEDRAKYSLAPFDYNPGRGRS